MGREGDPITPQWVTTCSKCFWFVKYKAKTKFWEYKTSPAPLLALAASPDRRVRHLLADGGAAVGRGAARLRALLHPLHHQAQQRTHRLVHCHARGRTRLKVRDAMKPEGG